ncbi:PRRT1-like protein [Mya arenaria]|uniref:PRRT1-like protein n=1 Tax=Mya arenaria TaxID=6604 RepID=A0ABY7DS01_MYAAR|nr:proline-rich transmembrane protein 1-like [Mya arenaria]WAQ99381.1 PRRT1-like protein [Mya arenaria]
MEKADLDDPPPYGTSENDGQQNPGGQQYPEGQQQNPADQQYGQSYPIQQPYEVRAGQQQYVGQPYGGQNMSPVIVTQPGYPEVVTTMPRPPDYMGPSVFACLCCFWPTGICAIYYASQANTAAASGDMAMAKQYSNNARNLMITSIVLGIICIILTIVLRAVIGIKHTYKSY